MVNTTTAQFIFHRKKHTKQLHHKSGLFQQTQQFRSMQQVSESQGNIGSSHPINNGFSTFSLTTPHPHSQQPRMKPVPSRPSRSHSVTRSGHGQHVNMSARSAQYKYPARTKTRN